MGRQSKKERKMAKTYNKTNSAVMQATEATAVHYAKKAKKPTAWDKVKDFIDTGREYRVKAIEDTATYYADRLNSRKQNNLLVREEDAPEPDTLSNMSYSGDPKLNAYLQKIRADADKAVYDPRPAEKPAILNEVKNFVNTGKQHQTQAIENTAAYYKAAAMNSPRVELGSMSPSRDPEFDAYLQKINTDPRKATSDSRAIERPVILDEVKDFVNTGRQYQVQGIEDRTAVHQIEGDLRNQGEQHQPLHIPLQVMGMEISLHQHKGKHGKGKPPDAGQPVVAGDHRGPEMVAEHQHHGQHMQSGRG